MGQGWDIHRLVPGRSLILGGLAIPFEKGEDAHSDGDVLIHALMDALLGALALEDIGSHYPSSDKKWEGADSLKLLEDVMGKVHSSGYILGNMDCTVVMESPKLGVFRGKIRENLAAVMKCPVNKISFKAKTKEKQDAVGRGEAIEAQVVVLLIQKGERPSAAEGGNSLAACRIETILA